MQKGTPVIDDKLCKACGLCSKICPSLTIQRRPDGKPFVNAYDAFLGCIACGHCTAVCASGAVRVTGRGMKADDVFPLPAPSERATPGSLTALLEARRSVRHYQDRPIEGDKLDRLLSMASTAPMGFPPSDVGVVVINRKDLVQELAADVCQRMKKWLFMAKPPGSLLLRLMMDRASVGLMKELVLPVAEKIIEARAQGNDFLFYNAPCVLLFHYPMKDTVDPAIVCSYATIAAEALGLGSCIIGTVPPALQGSKDLKAKWGIPEGRYVSMAMIVGYPAVAFVNGIRRRFASVKRIP